MSATKNALDNYLTVQAASSVMDIWNLQSLTYICHLSIEPNYHYSPNKNKSELPTLMDEYVITGKASPRSERTEVQCAYEVVEGRQAETGPQKNSLSRASHTNYFLFKFYLFMPTLEIPRYTIITIDTEHGKLAEVSR